MRKNHFAAFAVLGALILTSACSRDVQVMSAPNLNVYTSYSDKMPGKWALYVQSGALVRDVHTDGFECAAYNYPLDLDSSFRQSVAATFRNLVSEVNLVSQAPSVTALARDGYAGLIRVNGDDLRAHLTIKPGFFSATAEVTIEVDAGVIVETQFGRLLGTQATGTGRADHGSGVFCSGTGPAIGEASEIAMKAAIGQLGERFSNSPQVRSAGVSLTQTQNSLSPGSVGGNLAMPAAATGQILNSQGQLRPDSSGRVCTHEEQVQARIARQNGYTGAPNCL